MAWQGFCFADSAVKKSASILEAIEPEFGRTYVMLEVKDTESGVTPEEVEHASEPFFTTKDVGQGTGLGLSMVYGFAKQSGGFTQIESQPGQGAAVRLCLPRATEEQIGAVEDIVI